MESCRVSKGFQGVFAIRPTRQEGALTQFCCRVCYRLLGRIAEMNIHADAGDFCVMDRRWKWCMHTENQR